jgi:hypothetical protein
MTQPIIIMSVIQELGIKENTNSKSAPEFLSTVLKDGAKVLKCNYWREIGKLNFLCSLGRPEIACHVLQCMPQQCITDTSINLTTKWISYTSVQLWQAIIELWKIVCNNFLESETSDNRNVL